MLLIIYDILVIMFQRTRSELLLTLFRNTLVQWKVDVLVDLQASAPESKYIGGDWRSAKDTSEAQIAVV